MRSRNPKTQTFETARHGAVPVPPAAAADIHALPPQHARQKPTPDIPTPILIKQAATRARTRARHGALIASFFAMVLAPACVSIWYLYAVAQDQYASHLGFSVRQEDSSAQVDLLGNMGALTQGATQDSDVLYEFIQSADIVAAIDEKLDLRDLFGISDKDPVFGLRADASRETLHDYWQRMVKLSYDTRTQLIELRVTAFDPKDAQAIANEIFEESSALINAMSAIAQEDATRHARTELQSAKARLDMARATLKDFRSRHSIVDPAADLDGQMGLLNSLQSQKAQALIDLGLARANDPRIGEIERKIDVISQTIVQERRKLGGLPNETGGITLAAILQDYENLVVDQQFAEDSYTAALANYDAALQDARRKSRYLAPYIHPSLAEDARYPQRFLFAALVACISLLIWSILTLILYSIRDRR